MNTNDDIRRLKKLEARVNRLKRSDEKVSLELTEKTDQIETVADLYSTHDVDIFWLLKTVKILQDEVILIKERLDELEK